MLGKVRIEHVRYGDSLRPGWSRGSNPGKEGRFPFSENRSDRLCGTLGFLFNGYWDPFPGLKREVREFDHSLPSRTEV